jgi:hypothetical protein
MFVILASTLSRFVTHLKMCHKAKRRPGRVPHRRSGSRRARHARGQWDAGVPHARGKPWAGPSGMRLAIPIGVPQGGGWLLNDRQSQKVLDYPRPHACLTQWLGACTLSS